MATGTYAPNFLAEWYDDNGDPLNGGTIETFIAGTSTQTPVYSDVTLLSAYSNPLTLNSAGRLPSNGSMFLAQGISYKMLVKKADGTVIATPDSVQAVPGSATGSTATGTAGETLTSGNAVYLSDGSGGKTQGLWYKADSSNTYSSTTPAIGIALATITSGTSGTILLNGVATNLSSLTTGAIYYLSTSGTVTSTAPANKRIIGQADSTTSLVVGPIPPVVTIDTSICCGRLTLTTAVPVTTADVTAATTLFFTPYKGGLIALYDGVNWNLRTLTEISIAIPATTATVYDVWVFDNSGTPALELLAWTNDTTRATALTTQNGVLVKTGAVTRRYVGSCRTTGVSGQTEDSAAKRYVWNYYNRVRRFGRVTEPTDTYNYTTDTYRQAMANTANQLDFVVGVAEALLSVRVVGIFSSGSADQFACVSIGEDSTTTAITGVTGQGSGSTATGAAASAPLQTWAAVEKYPAVGRHFYVWLERAGGGGTVAWYGDNGTAAKWQSGISGFLEG